MKASRVLGIFACILLAGPALAKDKAPKKKNFKDLTVTKRMDKASAHAQPVATPVPNPRAGANSVSGDSEEIKEGFR